jgi:hypothetical protein
VVTGLEDRVITKRVEIVFAINQAAKTSQNDFEERIQGFKDCVFAFSQRLLRRPITRSRGRGVLLPVSVYVKVGGLRYLVPLFGEPGKSASRFENPVRELRS